MANFHLSKMSDKFIQLILLALWLFCRVSEINAAESKPSTKLAEIGKHIYLTGTLPSGQKISATVGGDAAVRDSQFACVTCHRRSRMGTSEGGKQISPLTATALFKPELMANAKGSLPTSFKPVKNQRKPYTDETLARAIRQGIGLSGNPLDPIMPRYTLDKASLAALIAYLKTEVSTKIPGVDDETLHFATVVTEGADTQKGQAMLEVINGYFSDKNANTRHNDKRAKFSAYKMYQVYRKWRLHLWTLKGKPETWRKQLESYYKKQPVLATVGGLSNGSWQPIHEFCEQFEVACLFPNTNYPAQSENGFYTVYFSKGAVLAAQTLAAELQKTANNAKLTPFMQVYREDGPMAEAASQFRRLAQKSKSIQLNEFSIKNSQADFIESSLERAKHGSLVLWLEASDLEKWANAIIPVGVEAVYIPAVAIDSAKIEKWDVAIRNKVILIYPWDLPETLATKTAKAKAWLTVKKIAETDLKLQAETFFSLQVLGEVISHLLDNFSSTYLVERIEGMLGNRSAYSIYPHVSLGTNQRFASKGSYLVKFSPEGKLIASGEWIVP